MIFLLILSIFQAGPGLHPQAGTPTREDFEARYPSAYDSMRETYDNIQMTVREKFEARRSETLWEAGGAEGSYRWVELDRVAPGALGKLPLTVAVARPDFAFALQRDSESSPYSVARMGSINPGPEFEQFLATMIYRRAQVMVAPFSILSTPLPEILSDPKFRIVGLERTGSDDRPTLRVDWEHPLEDGAINRGNFEFLADSLALKAYDIRQDAKDPTGKPVTSIRSASLDYEGESRGVPLIRRMTARIGFVGGELTSRTFDVEQIIPEGPPAEAFTLESFGISTTPVRPPTPIAYYLIGLAVLCLALIVAIKVFQARSRANATA